MHLRILRLACGKNIDKWNRNKDEGCVFSLTHSHNKIIARPSFFAARDFTTLSSFSSQIYP